MPPSFCVPVVFNEELVQKQNNDLYTKSVAQFSLPWCLIVLRALLVVLAFAFMIASFALAVKEAKPKYLSLAPFLMFFPQLMFTAIDMVLFFILVDEGFKFIQNSDDLSEGNRSFGIFLAIRSTFALALITCTVIWSAIGFAYPAAIIGCSLFDILVWKLYQRHYSAIFKDTEKQLISTIQAKVGFDNCVSKPVITEFEGFQISDEKLWEGVPISSRDTSIRPSCSYMVDVVRKTHGRYFVNWRSYREIIERMESDSTEIAGLRKRNSKLRSDLLRQNEWILELRTKIFGPDPDCTDVDEIPICPPPVMPWNPVKAQGVFVAIGEHIAAYVTLPAFLEMAVHAALMRKSITSLEGEKQLIEEALQTRKKIVDFLIVNMLNEKEPKKEESVRIQIED